MSFEHLKQHVMEKDVEEALYEGYHDLRGGRWLVAEWIGRQVRVPSGVLDLLGLSLPYRIISGSTIFHDIVVAEVKNVPIDASALTQVSRYAYDVREIIEPLMVESDHGYRLFRAVIGPSISDTTFREAEALGVDIFTFELNLVLSIGGRIAWKDDFVEARQEEYSNARQEDTFSFVLQRAAEAEDTIAMLERGTAEVDAPESE